MKDRFWRVLSVAGVAGLFYVGHGLHGSADGAVGGAMPWENVAQGVVVDPTFSPWGGGRPVAVTAHYDGRTLYFWDRDRNGAVSIRVVAGDVRILDGMEGHRPGETGVQPQGNGSGRRSIPMNTVQKKGGQRAPAAGPIPND